jgi:glycosyltransferase involved in cell wall biosynthesis
MNAALEKVGVHCEVVCLDDPKEPFLGNDPFPVHAIGPAKTIWRYSDKLLPWLRANIDRFDVVITHGLWLYHSYATWLASAPYRRQHQHRPSPIKFFVMPHGMLDPWFQYAKGRKLKAARNWLYWKLIERRVVNESDGVLFTSEIERELARQPFWPYCPRKEILIRYGIEQPACYQQAMQESFHQACPDLPRRPYWLYLSRIHEKKGVDLLLKAYATLAIANPNLPKLVIAGPGLDSSYGQTIQRIVDNNPLLRDRVCLPGMLTGRAKWGALYGCEVFILPSHQENFGIAVAEALACAKPVLLSDQVNIWREIVSGHAGLVDKDSGQGVSRLLDAWLNMAQSEKQQMGQQAEALFYKQFEIGSAAQSLLEAVSEDGL